MAICVDRSTSLANAAVSGRALRCLATPYHGRSTCLLYADDNFNSALFRDTCELVVDSLTLAHRPINKGAQQLLFRIELNTDPLVQQIAD